MLVSIVQINVSCSWLGGIPRKCKLCECKEEEEDLEDEEEEEDQEQQFGVQDPRDGELFQKRLSGGGGGSWNNLENGATQSENELWYGRPKVGKVLSGVTIAHGGVLPNINPVLLPKIDAAESAEKTTRSPKNDVFLLKD